MQKIPGTAQVTEWPLIWVEDGGAQSLCLCFWEAAWQAGFSRIALEGTKINSKPDGHFYVVY